MEEKNYKIMKIGKYVFRVWLIKVDNYERYYSIKILNPNPEELKIINEN